MIEVRVESGAGFVVVAKKAEEFFEVCVGWRVVDFDVSGIGEESFKGYFLDTGGIVEPFSGFALSRGEAAPGFVHDGLAVFYGDDPGVGKGVIALGDQTDEYAVGRT